jgi:hypothetical protein
VTTSKTDLATTPRLAYIPTQRGGATGRPTTPGRLGRAAAWIATLALVAGLLATLTFLGSGRSTAEVLAEDLDAEFTYTVSEDARGLHDGMLSVAITNTADETRDVAFTVHAIAADGTSLGTDTGSIAALPAGAVDRAALFTGRSPQDMARLEQARFEIVEASSR